MSRHRCRALPLTIVLTAILAGCSSRATDHISDRLDAVEYCLNSRPDSALALLQRIDSTALSGRAVKARYALLKTMALDKCYRDITAPGLLDPAVSWYTRHGSPDDKLKINQYQGRIQQDLGNPGAAIIAYSRAEKYAGKVKDRHALGLLYVAIASVYNSVFNTQQELLYNEKACEVFRLADDPLYGSSLGNLALSYQNVRNWALADSLFQIAIASSDAYPDAQKQDISNYARMKLLQPDKDPEGAIALLKRRRDMSGSLSARDAGVYAYASELLGDRHTADALVSQIRDFAGPERPQVLMWMSRIAVLRGDYKLSSQSQSEAYRLEYVDLETKMADSVTKALHEEASREAAAARSRLHVIATSTGILILLGLSLILWLMLRKKRIEAECSRLLYLRERLQEEFEKQEMELHQIREENAMQSMQISNQQERIYAMEKSVAREREIYTRERVARLRQIGELRSTFWWRERGGMREEDAISRIKQEIAYVFQTDNDGRSLIRRLDTELDGAVSTLRAKLHLRGKPREVLFLCCCILDLESEMIAEIIGTSKANVYEKRSRLRARIRSLNDPFLAILVEKN